MLTLTVVPVPPIPLARSPTTWTPWVQLAPMRSETKTRGVRRGVAWMSALKNELCRAGAIGWRSGRTRPAKGQEKRLQVYARASLRRHVLLRDASWHRQSSTSNGSGTSPADPGCVTAPFAPHVVSVSTFPLRRGNRGTRRSEEHAWRRGAGMSDDSKRRISNAAEDRQLLAHLEARRVAFAQILPPTTAAPPLGCVDGSRGCPSQAAHRFSDRQRNRVMNRTDVALVRALATALARRRAPRTLLFTEEDLRIAGEAAGFAFLRTGRASASATYAAIDLGMREAAGRVAGAIRWLHEGSDRALGDFAAAIPDNNGRVERIHAEIGGAFAAQLVGLARAATSITDPGEARPFFRAFSVSLQILENAMRMLPDEDQLALDVTSRAGGSPRTWRCGSGRPKTLRGGCSTMHSFVSATRSCRCCRSTLSVGSGSLLERECGPPQLRLQRDEGVYSGPAAGTAPSVAI